MKLINPSFRIIEQEPGIEGAWKMVEKAARVCYQSEQRNTDETSEQFCKRVLLKHEDKAKNHLRPLEFGTVYLTTVLKNIDFVIKYLTNPWSKVECVSKGSTDIHLYITTNLRVIYENNWWDDLQYGSEPVEKHPKRVTINWTISRGIADEFRTHVSLSSCMESTRYCNYSKGKFNNNLTFVIPTWITAIEEGEYDKDSKFPPMYECDNWQEFVWYNMVKYVESKYLDLVHDGVVPQQAREILPLSIKANLIQCGFIKDWERFFDLRSEGVSGPPHPDSVYIASKAKEEFKKYAN